MKEFWSHFFFDWIFVVLLLISTTRSILVINHSYYNFLLIILLNCYFIYACVWVYEYYKSVDNAC